MRLADLSSERRFALAQRRLPDHLDAATLAGVEDRDVEQHKRAPAPFRRHDRTRVLERRLEDAAHCRHPVLPAVVDDPLGGEDLKIAELDVGALRDLAIRVRQGAGLLGNLERGLIDGIERPVGRHQDAKRFLGPKQRQLERLDQHLIRR